MMKPALTRDPKLEPDPTRAVNTLGEMLLAAAGRHHCAALEERHGGENVGTSYADLAAQARAVAAGLIALGVREGDRVAIFATTCARWTVADYGALCAGAVVVPVYHTSSVEECGYVLSHSGATVVFCGDAGQAATVQRARESCPDLRHVILLEGQSEAAISFDELLRRGAVITDAVIEDRISGNPDGLATIVYTSGTTSPPKGCMLTHANILATARMYVDELGIEEGHVLYQFLPLAHVMARVAQAVVISAGATISLWSGDATRIVDELAERHPTHFPAVPRVYEKIHGAIMGRVQDGSALNRMIFGWSIAQGRRQRRRSGRKPSLRYGDGEILIRGPQMFRGYYRDPAATEAALGSDGWLRTGDLGSLSGDGFLTITGRKKDLIITSNGKNITPVNIESELRETRFIREAVVFGDNRPYLVALLSPDLDETAKLAARLGIDAGGSPLANDPRVRAEIQREVDAVNERVARIEQIKRFAILERDLTEADGELTPTLKVKRGAVYEKYADVFAALYEAAGP